MGRLDAADASMKGFSLHARTIAALVIALAAALSLSAHVGSPDVYYEGDAGPYHLFVTVRAPQVIPGVAEIQIRCATKDVRAIQTVPMRLSGPLSNYPPTPALPQQPKQTPQFSTATLS